VIPRVKKHRGVPGKRAILGIPQLFESAESRNDAKTADELHRSYVEHVSTYRLTKPG
jgi:hypothetical protein